MHSCICAGVGVVVGSPGLTKIWGYKIWILFKDFHLPVFCFEGSNNTHACTHTHTHTHPGKPNFGFAGLSFTCKNKIIMLI